MESSKLAKIEQKPLIRVVKRKPCDSGKSSTVTGKKRSSRRMVSFFLAPEITLPPVSVSNQTGSNVFLTCEAAGVPLPVVEWVYTTTSGKQIVYPSRVDALGRFVSSRILLFSGRRSYLHLGSWRSERPRSNVVAPNSIITTR